MTIIGDLRLGQIVTLSGYPDGIYCFYCNNTFRFFFIRVDRDRPVAPAPASCIAIEDPCHPCTILDVDIYKENKLIYRSFNNED